MKKLFSFTIIAVFVLVLVSCEHGEVYQQIFDRYELYQYTDPDDAQYVFVSLRKDELPTIYNWCQLKEEVFDDVIAGNFSLPLSNGYHIDKHIHAYKVYRSTIKWNDLAELKSNKYAFGDRYVWCTEGDSIICGVDEDNYLDDFGQKIDTLLYTKRIVLADHFLVERRPKITTVSLRAEKINDLFFTVFGYSPCSRILPLSICITDYGKYETVYGDDEDIRCYPVNKAFCLYTPEERDSIVANAFTKKAKDIRADYVKLFNHIIENNELDKYKYRD